MTSPIFSTMDKFGVGVSGGGEEDKGRTKATTLNIRNAARLICTPTPVWTWLNLCAERSVGCGSRLDYVTGSSNEDSDRINHSFLAARIIVIPRRSRESCMDVHLSRSGDTEFIFSSPSSFLPSSRRPPASAFSFISDSPFLSPLGFLFEPDTAPSNLPPSSWENIRKRLLRRNLFN